MVRKRKDVQIYGTRMWQWWGHLDVIFRVDTEQGAPHVWRCNLAHGEGEKDMQKALG